jgi:hypothetical protein
MVTYDAWSEDSRVTRDPDSISDYDIASFLRERSLTCESELRDIVAPREDEDTVSEEGIFANRYGARNNIEKSVIDDSSFVN